jgi:hypothetical protein
MEVLVKRLFIVLALCAISGLLATPLAQANQSMTLSSAPAGMTILQENQQGITLKLQLNKLDFQEISTAEGTFTLLTGDGLVRSQDIGQPNLPTANQLLAIPFGCDLEAQVVDSKVDEYSLADLGIEFPIMPTQPSLSKSQDPESVPFEYNRATYAQTGFYSQPLAMAKTVGIMRSVNIGLIVVAPFEYNPTQKILRVYKEVTVKIAYKNADWNLTRQMQQNYYSPAFEPVYGSLLNYSGYKDESMITTDLTKYPIKYLIISNRMFQAQLAPFIQWKIKRGFKVTTAYTDSIGTTNTAIKSYIQSIYNSGTPSNPAPSFVLLVGDAQQIPPFQFSGHISDLSFCEFTNDNIPEIYYGRFSAQTTAQLQPQIDKTLEYEQYLMPDPSYLGNCTMIAGVDASHGSTWGNGQINYGTTYYFNAAHGLTSNTYLYPNSGSNAAAIRATVNSGVGYINYTAHGSHDGWYEPEFNSTQVQALTNNHKYPLAVGNCCLTNTFGTDYSTPCQGEYWLQVANKGAIGYIGASNSSYWDEDYWWGVGYKTVVTNPTYSATNLGAYDGIFHDHSEPTTEYYIYNDAINFRGNLAVTQANGSSTAYYWQIYHLMGDPSVMTYFKVPPANSVVHAATILITATTFTVQAVPGSYVGISFGGVLKGAAYIGTSGTVDVPVTAMGTPGTVDIVVTAQNRIPYISTIQAIAPSGPYVVFDSYAINDGAGNNDGLVNNGESIVLGVQLKNVGPNNAQNVVATLAESDTFVTVTDNSETYGSITGNNGVVNRAQAFAFTVSPNTPDAHNISFQLTITGTALDTWNANFTIPVHSPNLGLVSVVVNDNGGNGNGILDPGESGDLTVAINNSGSAQANTVVATLSETDTYVSVPDAQGSFGNIAPSGNANNAANVFRLTATSACPMGHALTLNMLTNASSGYSTNLSIPFMVGDRAVIYTDDFSTNQGWTGLAGSGEWTIGPAVGGAGSDSYGEADPAADHSPSSDNKVLGNDLTSGTGGDYSASLASTYYVTSPVINCSTYTGVQMTYWRWLGVESSTYDHATLQAYNGSTWITLFANSTTTIDESAWSQLSHDLSTIADHNARFQIRFGIGVSDGSWQYCGWNIDDIEIKGYGSGAATYPNMSYTPGNFSDSLVQGETANKILRVANTGEGVLRVNFSTTNSWISLNEQQYEVDPSETLSYTITLNPAELNTPGTYNGNVNFTSNDSNHPSGSIPIHLLIYAPSMSISRSAFSDTLDTGGSSSLPLVIVNAGPGRLNWDIDASVTDRILRGDIKFSPNMISSSIQPVALGFKQTDKEKETKIQPYYPPVTAGHGGPDTFGHKWTDSDEPNGPAYNWIDISTIGTVVSLTDDDYVGPISIGFNFPFYENSYSDLYIGSNGIITFGAGSGSVGDIGIPNVSSPNDLLAIWWDDLYPAGGGDIYYYYDNTASRFIVSFINVANYSYPSGTGALTFQAILYPSGKITYNYGSMYAGTDDLLQSTVGLENAGGTDGLQVVYNAAYMHDNLAINFSSGSWLATEPTSGFIGPNSRDTIYVNFDAADLSAGAYAGNLLLVTNDPNMDTVTIPVNLVIQGGSVGCSYTPGDVNGDDQVLGGDVTFSVRFFKGLGSNPSDSCWNDSTNSWLFAAGDVNGNCEFRGSDITLLVAYMKGVAEELYYCPQTPPVVLRHLIPGWIWDKENNSIRRERTQRINSSSINNTLK